MAQVQSRQLEPRLAPGTKMLARFLLTLNDLDEFGFKPGTDSKDYYRGNLALAHYPLFEKLLDDYGIGEAERQNYTSSEIANDLRNFLEDTYSDFTVLTALLAVAEQEVCIFSPPLRQGTAKVGLKVDDGYYFVHGTSDEEEVNAFDDDHEDDLWFILMQAMTPDDHAKVREKALAYCDLWDRFGDHQLNFRENAVETSVS